MVMMQGNIVHRLITFLKYPAVPFRIMVQERGAGYARHRFHLRINPLHCLGGLMGKDAVFPRLFLPGCNLPRTVHLVAQVPDPDAIRVRMPVLLPQVRPPGPSAEIGICHTVRRVLQRPRAQVHGVNRLRPGFLRPLQVFVMSHIVGNVLAPCHIQMRFAFRHRTDGILPLPAGNEIAAGQAYARKTGFLQCGIKILPQSLLIRGRMLRVVHASVHHGTDRFQERAEKTRRNLSDSEIRMYRQ